jgi:hypothetical protein
LCRDSPDCLQQAVRRGAFSRALRGEVGQAQLEQLVLTLGPGTGRSGKEVETGSGASGP